MSKFIALPVSQGDAFYLERKDFRVLVDGGKSKSAISPWMSSICKTDYLDVLVCTHNDADHANGIAGLLENWEGTINEVWLPGSWTNRIKDVFEEPHQFCSELIRSLSEYDGDKSIDSLEAIEINCNTRDKIPAEFELGSIIEGSMPFPASFIEICLGYPGFESYYFFYLHRLYSKDRNLISVFWEAIDAANNIRTITESAYHRGCKIRFFEFGSTVSGGELNKLDPVNSKEIVDIRHIYKLNALEFIALSVSNMESLVFYSPENANEPAVLFTADSDLKFTLPFPSPQKDIIVTSPHHGSDKNAHAYSVVATWLNGSSGKPIWVRSDCRSKSRPGSSFLKQKSRVCTLCNCDLCQKQTVKLHSKKGQWQRANGTRSCTCK